MTEPQTEDISPAREPLSLAEPERTSAALTEAARELQSAGHDAQVAFDCIALGELDRAHTHALTVRVALDAAVTALAAALDREDPAKAALSPAKAALSPAKAALSPAKAPLSPAKAPLSPAKATSRACFRRPGLIF